MELEVRVYQQIVGFSMGINVASFIADLFFYCYEKDKYVFPLQI